MAVGVVVVGAGGHGRETVCVVQALAKAAEATGVEPSLRVLGLVDPVAPDPELLAALGVEYLGSDEVAPRLPRGTAFAVGIGDGGLRRSLAARWLAAGHVPMTLVDPTAVVGPDVVLGAGAVLFAGVVVTTHVRIGAQTHLNRLSTVGHDCVLGAGVTVAPLASISGRVHLDDDVTIGTTACVNEGLRVGAGTLVGSGAAVVTDLPAGVVAVGVPARVIRSAVARS
jgi:sugar O-acyltransferase (sialic acid O-acetyltransferase NeuD family)